MNWVPPPPRETRTLQPPTVEDDHSEAYLLAPIVAAMMLAAMFGVVMFVNYHHFPGDQPLRKISATTRLPANVFPHQSRGTSK